MGPFFSLMIADELRWHLDARSQEAPLDIWACRPVESPTRIALRIFEEGRRVDYNRISFAVPVVSNRFANVVSTIAASDVQRLPATVLGDGGSWEVLNIVTCIDCIDHNQSCIQYYPPNHPGRPGKPRGVVRLVLDLARVGNHHVFRPMDWEIEIIISASVKTALEAMGATGLEYVPVT